MLLTFGADRPVGAEPWAVPPPPGFRTLTEGRVTVGLADPVLAVVPTVAFEELGLR